MNEYETPITDEICRTVDRNDLRDTFEEVRDLERKLAMCRDALYLGQKMQRDGDIWSVNPSAIRAFLDASKLALDQTK